MAVDFTSTTEGATKTVNGRTYTLTDGAWRAGQADPSSDAKGYIDGLQMQWVSGTALTVSSGAAYIEGSGNIVAAPSAIAKAGLSLAASTWYHVYLYLNAGTPDIEIVTTAPVAYSGTARSKTGDTSRRYVGSAITRTDSTIACFRSAGEMMMYDVQAAGQLPFRVLSNGVSTATTAVSVAGCAPVTGAAVLLKGDNTATNVVVVSIGRNASGGSVFQGSLFNGQRGQWLIALDGQQFSYAYSATPTGGGVYFDVTGYVLER